MARFPFWPSVSLFFVSCAAGVGSSSPVVTPSSPEPTEAARDGTVDEPGWELSGEGPAACSVHRDADGAWLLEPVSDSIGKYATWMRHIDGSWYREKRVRITARFKTQGATRRVDFWARAQGQDS